MPSSAQQLHTIFQEQITAASQLIDALEEESNALTLRDIESIQNLSVLKNRLSLTLEELGKQQNEFLRQQQKNDSADGLDAYIAEQEGRVAIVLEQQKTKLHAMLESCQTLNLVNGSIIAASKQSAETALAILRGQLTTENLVYSAGGQPVSDHSKNSLTKA